MTVVDEDIQWMRLGACRTEDPDTFFPDTGVSSFRAKLVCGGCPVEGPCLAYALRNDEPFGVWGGKSEQERRKILRLRRKAGN